MALARNFNCNRWRNTDVKANRSILHVDMDAFFVSFEQMDDPNLRAKPLLVGYDGPLGVDAFADQITAKFAMKAIRRDGRRS